MTIKIAALTLLVLTTSVVCYRVRAAEPPLEFTPRNGFTGASKGIGTLKMFLGAPRRFHVASQEIEQRDGTFRLEQRVTFQGEAPKDRVWILTTVTPNQYSAWLSDADGPVTGSTSGTRLSLRFRVKGPMLMQQELQLLPDGKTIINVGTITLLGVPVGNLQETITRNNRVVRSGKCSVRCDIALWGSEHWPA